MKRTNIFKLTIAIAISLPLIWSFSVLKDDSKITLSVNSADPDSEVYFDAKIVQEEKETMSILQMKTPYKIEIDESGSTKILLNKLSGESEIEYTITLNNVEVPILWPTSVVVIEDGDLEMFGLY